MFLAFSPENMCSDLIRQIKSLLSLIWQVLKVLIVKFQASTLDQCHHLFINLSCISVSKPLNAQYCTWARSHRGRHYDCALVILYLHASDVHQHSKLNRSRATTLLWGTDSSLLQNIRAYKKWIPLFMEQKSFPSKESDTKILQSMHFAYKLGIISSYSNIIYI